MHPRLFSTDVICPWCEEEVRADGEIREGGGFYFVCPECLSNVNIDVGRW